MSSLFLLCALVFGGALLLGGGTRSGFLSDAVLQLLAIPLLLAAVWRFIDVPLSKPSRRALWFCFALALLPVVQLVPLPPAVWTALPNRAPLVESFSLVGRPLPWMPMSVSPHATWLSALSLLPPLAIFLGTLLLGYRERRALSLVALAVGTLSVFIGLIQVAQGPSSPLRFFEFTNTTEAVGFFANRNHFAALLYCLMLFATAWVMEAASATLMATDQKRYDTVAIVALVGGFTLLVVLISAQAMARSRAGLGLSMVALVGAFALAMSDRRSISDRRAAFRLTTNKLLTVAIALAVMFAVQYALYRILDRFGSDPLADARIPFGRNTIEAATAFMPFGSGLGTFVPVYGMFETPDDALPNIYVNRAHNDILELWLEAGAIGLGLMGVFAIWLVLRSTQLWRRTLSQGVSDLDRSLARAATIAIALIIVHSFVDYPLRTGAMMAIMAFACALLLDPPVGAESREAVELRQGTRASARQHAAGRAAPAFSSEAPTPSRPSGRPRPSEAPSPASGERGSASVEWPEAWRQSAKPSSAGTNDKKSGSPKSPRN